MPPHEPLLTDRLGLRVLDGGALPIGPAWNAADVCSTYWRLYLNDAPGASIRLADGVYELAPDRLHFIPPWVRFSCHCRCQLGHFYAHFDLIGLPGTITRELFDRPVTLAGAPVLESQLRQLRDTFRSSRHQLGYHLRLKSAIWAALAQLLDSLPPEDVERCRYLVHGDHPVQAALQYVEDHLGETITNAALADCCHYSEDHFIRLFHDVVGDSPARYVKERRVGHAAQLLLFTRDSIERIAELTGFANRYHFTRVFTRHLGVSPAAYRRARRV